MPSSLSDKDNKGKTRQRNFQPALKALNNLVADLENSECPEDVVNVKTNTVKMKLQSVRLDHDNSKKNHTRNRNVAQSHFQKTQPAFEDIESKSSSDKSDDDSLEEISKSRVLTEIERLEEAQTGLEKKIKETREITKREDHTRNQRKFAEDKLRRLESKLEVLERRLELERTGRSRWTYVRRNIKKPRVGFHSSELLNRSWPSAKFRTSESSSEVSLKRADVIIEGIERKRNAEDVETKEESTEGKLLFKSRDLEKLNLTLKQNEIQECGETDLKGKDEDDETKDIQEEQHKIGNGDGIQGTRRQEKEDDRIEISKGWLRISDRPDDFVKRIDVSETKHSKEAWMNISEPGIVFAKRVFRTQAKVNNGLSLSLGGKKIPLVQSSGRVKQDKKTLKEVGKTAVEPQKGQTELAEVGTAIVASSTTSQVKVVTSQDLTITTTFLPPIPVFDAKKRPRKALLEKVKDEQDLEQKETRVILIPNRQRVAKRRFLMYIRQLEFSKNHKLDQKEIVSNMADAIKDYGEVDVQEHPKEPTPRNALYLIGALSKNHLRPPTAPPN